MKILTLILGVFFSYYISAQDEEFKSDYIPNQVAIVLKDSSKLKSVLKVVSKNYKVILAQGSIIILQPVNDKQEITDEEISKLNKLKHVDTAHRDSVLSINDNTSSNLISCKTENYENYDLKLILDSLSSYSEQLKCPKKPTCSGISLNWAQERVDSRLALEELAKIAPTSKPINVGIVDSGFDESLQSSMSLPVVYHKGTDTADDQGNTDYLSGHGTAVAGLIGSKTGSIGPNSQIHFFNIISPSQRERLEKNPRSFGSTALSMAAIERACESGMEVINFSMGDKFDEWGEPKFRDEVKFKPILDKCAQKGVIVVKAAGNDGNLRQYETDNPDDAYLRVAALSMDGNYADFSTRGEIAAPGEDVSTQAVSQSEMEIEKSPCPDGEIPKGQTRTSGTSFAAPITTGILVDVIQVLKAKAHDKFSKLSGPKKVSLLSKIIRASTIDDSVNAYRAIMAARAWSENPKSDSTVEDLQNGIIQISKTICDKPTPSCQSSKSCHDQQMCIDEVRKQWLLCPERNNLQATQLIMEALGNDEITNAVMLFKKFKWEENTPLYASIKKKLIENAQSLITKFGPWQGAFLAQKYLGDLPFWTIQNLDNSASIYTLLQQTMIPKGIDGISQLTKIEREKKIDYYKSIFKEGLKRMIELNEKDYTKESFESFLLPQLVRHFGKRASYPIKDQLVLLNSLAKDPFFAQIKTKLESKIIELSK